jgi:hypothetical protein
MWRAQQGRNMTLSELEQLIEAFQAATNDRRRLGGYNADAPAILFLHESLTLLTREICYLRKEVWRMKTAKKKKP